MPVPQLQVAKNGTETWKVRYRNGSKNGSKTFQREKDATKFAGWLEKYGPAGAEKMLSAQQTTSESEPTVSEWCATHIESLPNVTEGTLVGYRRYARRDLDDLGPLPLSAVTPERVAQWVAGLRKRGLSGKSIANVHGFMSAAMKHAAEKSLIETNPCRGTKLPETIGRAKTYLTHDEFTRFLGCFSGRWIPMVQVLFGTGMRFGEITALTVGDLDLDAGMLSISKAWKKDGTLGTPKSRRSIRDIALSDELVTILRIQTDGRPGDALVFSTATGERITSPQFHTLAWQPAVDLANGIVPTRYRGRGRAKTIIHTDMKPLNPPLGKRPRVHDARHTCASWMLRDGVPIFDVSRHLGHEQITTTAEVYGHMMPSAQRDIRRAISRALSASRPELVP